MPFNLASWMSYIPGKNKLSALSIPGTHDSAARFIDPVEHAGDSSARLSTQTAGLREQLDSGIRFLDIRVGFTGGEFRVFTRRCS